MQGLDLLQIEKPARYMGGEMASVKKPNAEVRFVLAFPDVYEVGMSHLGLQILYNILNQVERVAAERVYAPWNDMESLLRHERTALYSLESGAPLGSADIIGFTLQYELSYTNILAMLDLSGIPLYASQRDENHPLIIGGGPCAVNPEPLAEFFDAFLIGDGEEAAPEIAAVYREWKREGKGKEELLVSLSRIQGVYIPSFFSVEYADDNRIKEISPLRSDYRRIRRRFVTDLDSVPYPTSPVIPFLKTIHDRVSAEIARGCTRGCRFCQAGYIYRPVRERSTDRLLHLIEETLLNTGYEEISLLSLSSGDYSCIAPLLKELMARHANDKVAVSLPSLRVGTLTSELVEEIKKVRKTGFTLAPEAATERLRRVINKGISDDDLLASAQEIYGSGWRLIKLYFMLGLPTENGEDLLGIAELAKKVKNQGRGAGGGEVNVAVSSFVPKAHTPFQWEPQISYEDILAKQEFLRFELKKRKLNFKWQDAPLSVMEGVFARGDRRLASVLVNAFKLGCRFDGWRECFDFGKWQKAFASAGIDPLFYLRARELDEMLPWDHIDAGVSREFLLREREAAFAEAFSPDCRSGACLACGVCNSEVKMQYAPAHASTTAAEEVSPHATAARIRIRFTKIGCMRYLSHLELLNLFCRAIRRGSIPIRYSQGFHPHPKFSFATALSVGVDSWAEYLDMELDEVVSAQEVMKRLNAVLPEGVEVLEATEVPLNAASLSVIMDKVRYRVVLPDHQQLDLPTLIHAFMGLDSYLLKREKKGKKVEIDLRAEISQLSSAGNVLEMVIGRGKPLEFASAITAVPPEKLAGSVIEKLEVVFKQ